MATVQWCISKYRLGHQPIQIFLFFFLPTSWGFFVALHFTEGLDNCIKMFSNAGLVLGLMAFHSGSIRGTHRQPTLCSHFLLSLIFQGECHLIKCLHLWCIWVMQALQVPEWPNVIAWFILIKWAKFWTELLWMKCIAWAEALPRCRTCDFATLAHL